MIVYPVFTDRKRFWHCDDPTLPKEKMRFAYFTSFKFGKEWREECEPYKANAKKIYDGWDKDWDYQPPKTHTKPKKTQK